MSLKDRHRSITIRGLVCPTDWDSLDRVHRVSILTCDEDEYEVEAVDAGELLTQQAGVEVLARGHLLSDYRKRKVIRIKSFTVIGPGSTEVVDGGDTISGVVPT